MAKTVTVELDVNELKMLLVAVRQVRHTFNIAEAQSLAAGEPMDPQYEPVQQRYDALERKLSALID